jgi:hypothetical protein
LKLVLVREKAVYDSQTGKPYLLLASKENINHHWWFMPTVQVLRLQNKKTTTEGRRIVLVREKGLEPSRLAALVPKTSVSTNSTTRA